MKNFIAAILLSMFCSSLLAETEQDDFGLRFTVGADTGFYKNPIPEFSVWADMYFFTRYIRLLFGFAMLIPEDDAMPYTSLQAIGMEYSYGFLPKHKAIVGLRFNKPYMNEKKPGLGHQRGMSYHVAYKYRFMPFQDAVLELGSQYQPYEEIVPIESLTLKQNTYFARLGWETYF